MSRTQWALWGERLFYGFLFAVVLADVLAWGGLTAFILRDLLPTWAAWLIAALVALGVVPFLVWFHGNTVVEIAVGAVIGLVLAGILWPVFARAREHRLRHHPRAAFAHSRVTHAA